jgi:hypothetical protein
MINASFDISAFQTKLQGVIDYSIGFLDGVQSGRTQFLENFGVDIIETLKQYIDSNARINPQLLHHVYEWNNTGSPSARLFDISYSMRGTGLSINSTFKQSTTIKNGSKVPFYDKATIMENGTPVTIKPVKAKALAFTVDGQDVFTKNDVTVQNPGGQTKGQYADVFNSFFNQYFTQAFLTSSGIRDYLESPEVFKNGLRVGKGTKSSGHSAGYKWIAGAGI